MDPGHITWIYQYDALNRQTQSLIVHPDGGSELVDTKTYDAVGNLRTDVDLHHNTTLTQQGERFRTCLKHQFHSAG